MKRNSFNNGFGRCFPSERVALVSGYLTIALDLVVERSGLSGKEIARRASMDPSNLSRILHGKNSCDVITYESILQACGYHISIQKNNRK